MRGWLLGAAAVLASTGVQAQTAVTESGDAGQTIGTAQNTSTGTAGVTITGISGNLTSKTDVDLYKIYIASPGTFSASTINAGTESHLDTNLFLFDSTGKAIATNDDGSNMDFRARLAAGNANYANLTAGTYYLAVGQSGNEAVNANNQLLFDMYTNGDSTSTRGAASGTNPATLSNFNGNTSFDDMGAYRIDLTGVTTGAAPEPASWALMVVGFGVVGGSLRRRRRPAPTATA